MKKASMKRQTDELRAEYDLRELKGVVRGKYYRRAMAGTNLVLLESRARVSRQRVGESGTPTSSGHRHEELAPGAEHCEWSSPLRPSVMRR
jgi:hypothetical protein